jgi:hypothetical protein
MLEQVAALATEDALAVQVRDASIRAGVSRSLQNVCGRPAV